MPLSMKTCMGCKKKKRKAKKAKANESAHSDGSSSGDGLYPPKEILPVLVTEANDADDGFTSGSQEAENIEQSCQKSEVKVSGTQSEEGNLDQEEQKSDTGDLSSKTELHQSASNEGVDKMNVAASCESSGCKPNSPVLSGVQITTKETPQDRFEDAGQVSDGSQMPGLDGNVPSQIEARKSSETSLEKDMDEFLKKGNLGSEVSESAGDSVPDRKSGARKWKKRLLLKILKHQSKKFFKGDLVNECSNPQMPEFTVNDFVDASSVEGSQTLAAEEEHSIETSRIEESSNLNEVTRKMSSALVTRSDSLDKNEKCCQFENSKDTESVMETMQSKNSINESEDGSFDRNVLSDDCEATENQPAQEKIQGDDKLPDRSPSCGDVLPESHKVEARENFREESQILGEIPKELPSKNCFNESEDESLDRNVLSDDFEVTENQPAQEKIQGDDKIPDGSSSLGDVLSESHGVEARESVREESQIQGEIPKELPTEEVFTDSIEETEQEIQLIGEEMLSEDDKLDKSSCGKENQPDDLMTREDSKLIHEEKKVEGESSVNEVLNFNFRGEGGVKQFTQEDAQSEHDLLAQSVPSDNLGGEQIVREKTHAQSYNERFESAAFSSDSSGEEMNQEFDLLESRSKDGLTKVSCGNYVLFEDTGEFANDKEFTQDRQPRTNQTCKKTGESSDTDASSTDSSETQPDEISVSAVEGADSSPSNQTAEFKGFGCDSDERCTLLGSRLSDETDDEGLSTGSGLIRRAGSFHDPWRTSTTSCNVTKSSSTASLPNISLDPESALSVSCNVAISSSTASVTNIPLDSETTQSASCNVVKSSSSTDSVTNIPLDSETTQRASCNAAILSSIDSVTNIPLDSETTPEAFCNVTISSITDSVPKPLLDFETTPKINCSVAKSPSTDSVPKILLDSEITLKASCNVSKSSSTDSVAKIPCDSEITQTGSYDAAKLSGTGSVTNIPLDSETTPEECCNVSKSSSTDSVTKISLEPEITQKGLCDATKSPSTDLVPKPFLDYETALSPTCNVSKSSSTDSVTKIPLESEITPKGLCDAAESSCTDSEPKPFLDSETAVSPPCNVTTSYSTESVKKITLGSETTQGASCNTAKSSSVDSVPTAPKASENVTKSSDSDSAPSTPLDSETTQSAISNVTKSSSTDTEPTFSHHSESGGLNLSDTEQETENALDPQSPSFSGRVSESHGSGDSASSEDCCPPPQLLDKQDINRKCDEAFQSDLQPAEEGSNFGECTPPVQQVEPIPTLHDDTFGTKSSSDASSLESCIVGSSGDRIVIGSCACERKYRDSIDPWLLDLAQGDELSSDESLYSLADESLDSDSDSSGGGEGKTTGKEPTREGSLDQGEWERAEGKRVHDLRLKLKSLQEDFQSKCEFPQEDSRLKCEFPQEDSQLKWKPPQEDSQLKLKSHQEDSQLKCVSSQEDSQMKCKSHQEDDVVEECIGDGSLRSVGHRLVSEGVQADLRKSPEAEVFTEAREGGKQSWRPTPPLCRSYKEMSDRSSDLLVTPAGTAPEGGIGTNSAERDATSVRAAIAASSGTRLGSTENMTVSDSLLSAEGRHHSQAEQQLATLTFLTRERNFQAFADALDKLNKAVEMVLECLQPDRAFS